MTAPNIILIMTDQQRYDTINALGFPQMQTPHMDRLVREGVSFDNAFCSAPTCVPSRASFFNAQYPHQLGVFCNFDAWHTSWVEQFQAAGYHTVAIGKMHTNPVDAPCGFDQRITVENPDRIMDFSNPHGVYYDDWDLFLNGNGVRKPSRETYRAEDPAYEQALGAFTWPEDDRYHPDVFVGSSVEWFLEQRQATSPLFMMVGFPGPHPPYSPTRRWLEHYSEADLPVPEFSQAERAAQPPPQATYRQSMIADQHDAVCWHDQPTPAQLLRLRRYYAAYVSLLDEQVGRVMDALERKGYLDNTIVVFTSDHGDCLGDHGQIQKWLMYDCVMRVPLAVWSPALLPAGKRIAALVQQMDLVPMLFELAGLEVQGGNAARSALPLVQGAESIREAVYAEHGPTRQMPDINLLSMLCTLDWKLVHYFDQPWGELYDLTRDPDERHNLWADAEHEAIRQTLIAQLMHWRAQSSMPDNVQR